VSPIIAGDSRQCSEPSYRETRPHDPSRVPNDVFRLFQVSAGGTRQAEKVSDERPQMITRIQLGASRLEHLHPKVVPVFLNETWMHLGDPKDRPAPVKRYSFSYLAALFRRQHIQYLLRRGLRKLLGLAEDSAAPHGETEELYGRTHFQEFFYRKGDALPFDNGSINYIFSEHFLEHLFFDEALSLLKECHRILKPFGVIRTCVPDADLRTYEPPEPVGFPDVKLPYTHTAKHKTRWSVYSLTEALAGAGFKPLPLRYCDRFGQYVFVHPSAVEEAYECCPDHEMIFDLSYIRRIDSLIVDGIKTPPA